VTLSVEDVDDSVRFYRGGTGFPTRDRETDGDAVRFELDGAWLSLCPRETLAAAEAAGGRTVEPAGETFWGGYSGCFADLDGHLWEVAYPELTDE
jgi:catechol 2,3-dioxygenase-like lactoylglutathione lyase family enzyme